MKKIIILFKIICLIILFIIIGKSIDYMIVDDCDSQSRLTIHDLYNEIDNIDVLFLGSSHCYHSFDPFLADELLDRNTFNAGTATQNLDGSFTLLKEVNKKNRVSLVCLELYYSVAEEPEYSDRTDMTSTYIISDYLKESINKYKYIFEASSKEHYANSLLRSRRYWFNLFNPDKMNDIIRKKEKDSYRNYSYSLPGTTSYKGKGFFPVDESIDRGNITFYKHTPSIDMEGISKDWMSSLQDIVNYCKEEGIELILVSAPMPICTVADIGNYDEYVNLVNEFASSNGVKYYDFNLCKEQYFPETITNFYDNDHLNRVGAEAFTKTLCDIINGNKGEEIFYDSFSKKFRELPKDLFGTIVEQDGYSKTFTINVISNVARDKIKCNIYFHSENKRTIIEENVDLGKPITYNEGRTNCVEIKVYTDDGLLNDSWIIY